MVVEDFVIGEVAFGFFVWGNNPGTDLEVECQNRNIETHAETYWVC